MRKDPDEIFTVQSQLTSGSLSISGVGFADAGSERLRSRHAQIGLLIIDYPHIFDKFFIG
jgi:hypothetical protein